jgi:hypothetical protein
MVSQDTPKKILRIDDATEPTRGESPPVAPSPIPSARNMVRSQMPGAGPTTPEQKYPASYQRALEVSEQARQEILEAQRMQQVANSNPIPTSVPVPVNPPAPAIEMPRVQQIEQLQSDLSLLALAGRIEEEVVVGGFKFKMSTLTSGEQQEVLIASNVGVVGDEIVKLGQLRAQILARVIRSVNGIPLEHLYQGTEVTSAIDKKLQFLKSMQMSLLMKLFEIYSKMIERSEKVFETVSESGDLLKN